MPEREPQHGAGEVDAIAGARSVTDEFLATFNAGDAAAHAATLAYPHVRLASGTVRVWATFEEAHAAMTVAMPALREPRAGTTASGTTATSSTWARARCTSTCSSPGTGPTGR